MKYFVYILLMGLNVDEFGVCVFFVNLILTKYPLYIKYLLSPMAKLQLIRPTRKEWYVFCVFIIHICLNVYLNVDGASTKN